MEDYPLVSKPHSIIEQIAEVGIVPVVKIEDAAHAKKLASALLRAGLNCVEITLRTPAALEAIAEIKDMMLVGAGTVLNAAQVDQAHQAGAQFIVAPGTNPTTIAHCNELGIPIIPGAVTATEIENLLELNITFAKFFPAEASGGPQMLKALSGPYSMMRFMPTGGIRPGNLADYLSLNAVFACGGSWFVKPDLIRQNEFDKIEELTREALEIVNQTRLADQ